MTWRSPKLTSLIFKGNVHQFATNFWTCHNSYAVVPCANIYSDQCIEMSKTKSPSSLNCDGNPLNEIAPCTRNTRQDNARRHTTSRVKSHYTYSIHQTWFCGSFGVNTRWPARKAQRNANVSLFATQYGTVLGRMRTLVAYPNVNIRWARVWTSQANIVILNSPRIQVYICVTWIPSHRPLRKIVGCACAENAGNVFPATAG